MTHFTGYILAAIRSAMKSGDNAIISEKVTIEKQQQNGAYGVHQARVRLAGDPNTYRLILAPADAPIEINGRPIGDHFAMPLGDG